MNRQNIRQLVMLGVCLIVSLLDSALAASIARSAAVYFSDSTVLTGKIRLTPGRQFKLNIPEAGSVSTTDMITGEEVEYGKVRLFDFGPIREMCFYPEKEEMLRAWRFIEKTKYNEKTAEADYTPAKKEYSGEPYPVRYLAAKAVFNSGEEIQGHLFSATVYLQTAKGTQRIVLRSKDRGPESATLDDLVYVTRIKMLDEGKNIAATETVKFTDMTFTAADALTAVTRDSLTPLPARNAGDNTFLVDSAFGEPFYLAARKDGKYIVGWPQTADKELLALTDDHLQRHRDFYNDNKLLGVMKSPDGKEVLALVNLRRRHAATNFGAIGGEWDKTVGGIVEPWRLSIWRWKYDKPNRQLSLSARGTFFRLIFRPDDPTPQVSLSEKLWKTSLQTGKIVIEKDPNEDLMGILK